MDNLYKNFMDDNFKTIYKILSFLEKSLDVEEIDDSTFNARHFDISETRFCKYLQMLSQADYITGIEFSENLDKIDYEIENPLITIKGLEYLSENSIMQRMYKAAKGIKDLVK